MGCFQDRIKIKQVIKLNVQEVGSFFIDKFLIDPLITADGTITNNENMHYVNNFFAADNY